MSRLRNTLLLLAAGLLLSGCGPTAEQSGRALLCALPFVFGLSYLLQRPYFSLWKLVRPELEVRHGPVLVGAALVAVGVVLAFVEVSPFVQGEIHLFSGKPSVPDVGGGGFTEWILEAVTFTLGTFVTFHFLLLRYLISASPRSAFTWAWAFPVGLWLAIGLGLAFRSLKSDQIMVLLVYPGAGILVPLVLIPVLFIEVLRKGKKQKEVDG